MGSPQDKYGLLAPQDGISTEEAVNPTPSSPEGFPPKFDLSWAPSSAEVMHSVASNELRGDLINPLTYELY